MQKQWHLTAISKILSRELENKQTDGRLNVTRLDNGYNTTITPVPIPVFHNWKSNKHFVDATSHYKRISHNAEKSRWLLQGNRFSSQFSSPWFRIKHVWHKCNIYPKECHMPALSDDIISHCLKMYILVLCRGTWSWGGTPIWKGCWDTYACHLA